MIGEKSFFVGRESVKKYLVSILMGAACLYLSRFGIAAIVGDVQIDIPWALILPMIVTMAYGTRYGIVAGLSGGAIYTFHLWPNNGWANLLTASLFMVFYAGLGTVSKTKIDEYGFKSLFHVIKTTAIFSVLLGIGYSGLCNRMLALNPPFWTNNTISHLDDSIILSFIVKDTINLLFLAISTDVLLSLPPVRRLFGLPVNNTMVHNSSVFLTITGISLLIWGGFVATDMVLFPADITVKKYLGLALYQYLGSGLIVTRVVINLVARRLEGELRIKDQNQLLESLNKDLTISNTELEKAKIKAEESDRLKTAFLANISHEIRTPMNGIMGFAELLNDETLPPEEKRKYRRIIRSSGKQLMTIIDEIIDISRIETGQLKVQNSEVSLRKLTEEVYNMTAIGLPEDSSLSIILDEPDKAGKDTIITDEGKLRQILLNFLNNAVKFTDEGTVTLGWRDKDREGIEFFVKDTGIGIDPSEHETIFNRFTQASNHDTSARGGSGLGLSISKGLADLIGGEIRVISKPGSGSTFTLSLPEITNDKCNSVKTDAGGRSVNPIINRQGKILIAEDNDASYDYYNILLRKMGFDVVRAVNGLDAVEKFRYNSDIRLVLMDLRMPVMDGYQAAAEIKKLDSGTPIIAQSAFTLSESQKEEHKEYFAGYISKPVRRDDLLKILGLFIN